MLNPLQCYNCSTKHFYVFLTACSHSWASSAVQDARHHRHWQRVLGQVGGLHLSTLSFPLPMSGTILGGTMELHGNNISLACFHGINFKSKSWALFSLKEPCISFATEAQEIPSPECKGKRLQTVCHQRLLYVSVLRSQFMMLSGLRQLYYRSCNGQQAFTVTSMDLQVSKVGE